jgi:hypothetical protein
MSSAAPRHEPEILLNNILSELRSATALVDQRDTSTRSRLSNLEHTVNDLMRRAGRPQGGEGFGETDERKSALGLLEQKHLTRQRRRRVSPRSKSARPGSPSRACAR